MVFGVVYGVFVLCMLGVVEFVGFVYGLVRV